MQKNRPAMNYDKLSRSLRYYYEKGIMQKVQKRNVRVKSTKSCFALKTPLHESPLCAGGWGALRLQVCVRARGAHLPGFPRQSAAQPQGRVRALRQRGGHGAAFTSGRKRALQPRTTLPKHGPAALL